MNTVTVFKPWGSFERITDNEISTVKLLYVNKGEEFSLQYHHKRNEFWKVIVGSPEITVGDVTKKYSVGDECFVPAETRHRVSAPENDVTILEVSTGEFDEEDIVRVEDKYNRNK